MLLLLATNTIPLDSQIVRRAEELEAVGYGAFDALHLSAAEAGMADVPLTTDARFIDRREPSAKAISQMTAKPSSRSLSLRDSRSCARLRQRGHLFDSHARRLRHQRRFGSADILRLRIRNSTGRQRRHRRDEIARRGCPRRPRFRRSIPGIARLFETAARAFLNFRTASLHDWMSIMEPDRIDKEMNKLACLALFWLLP